MRAERIEMARPRKGSIPDMASTSAVVALVVVAAILVSAPPLTVSVALVVGIATILLALVNPLYGLGALTLSIPFSSLGEISMGEFDVSSTELIVGVLMLTWLAKAVRRREVRITAGPIAVPIALFVGLVFLSSGFSPSLGLSLKEMLKWLELLLVYLFVINNVTSQRQVKAILVVLMIAAIAEAFVGYYQFFAQVGPDSFRIGRFLRAYGTFGQPNPFAGYLASVAILALALGLVPLVKRRATSTLPNCSKVDRQVGHALHGRSRAPGVGDADVGASRNGIPLYGRRPVRLVGRGNLNSSRPSNHEDSTQGMSHWLIIFFLGSLVLLSIAVLMSMSRGAWLGLAAGVAVVGAVISRKTLIALIVLVLLLSLVLLAGTVDLVPAQISGRITQASEYFRIFDASRVVPGPENWAMVERMANWQAAWGMYERHPWFGVGVGNFAVAYPDFALSFWQKPQGHAHNVYLNTLAEMGIFGLIAFLLLIGSFFYHAARSSRETRVLYAAVAIGVLGMLTVLSVHNLFDSLFVHGMNALLGLMLGLVTVVSSHSPTVRR